ncbi:MAG: hypothetical protein HZB11_00115 [Candidatus Yonathbacteria bacterium]|nr:hypothetical protein [Candidatus Yonathbacteria bacterium]
MQANTDARKLIKWGLSGLGVAIIIGYSYFVLNDFVRGPRIVILSPENGFSTTTPVIIIFGKAVHANNITINDAGTPVDLNGNFRSQLILAPGYNIMRVTAKDNYARTVEKTIEINLIQKETSSTTTATTTINQS